MSQPNPLPFLSHFAALRDPRQSAKVLYPLPEILLLLLCATVAGADDFVEITLWGEERLAFLRRFEPYRHGIPSHDTLCDVIAAIERKDIETACHLMLHHISHIEADLDLRERKSVGLREAFEQ